MGNSKRGKGKSKPPSRQKYEKEHPTVSFRLDKETYQRLKKHLDGTECSFGDFVRDALGREEATIEKRIRAREEQWEASKKEIKCLKDLVWQAHNMIQIVGQGKGLDDPYCPRCGDSMTFIEAEEIGADSDDPKLMTYACTCGYFMDAYKGFDPSSVRNALNGDVEGSS